MPPSARHVQLASTVTSMVCMAARFVLLDVTLRVLDIITLVPAKFALMGSTKGLEMRPVRNAKREPSWPFQTMLKITTAPLTASIVLCEHFRNIQDREIVLIVLPQKLRNQQNVQAFVHPASTNQTALNVSSAREESLRASRTNASVGCALLDITAQKRYHTWNATRAHVGFMELVCNVPSIVLSALPVQLASTVLETALTKGRIA